MAGYDPLIFLSNRIKVYWLLWNRLARGQLLSEEPAFARIEAAQSPTGTKGRSAASDFVVPFAVATLAAIGDARLLLRGGLRGAQRIGRHLWRMCFALFIASAAIFVARPQLFPALLSKTHVLLVLGIFPLALMVFWLARVLFTNAFRGTAASKGAGRTIWWRSIHNAGLVTWWLVGNL